MLDAVTYHQVTDRGLVERKGSLVDAKTSDGVTVHAVMERQCNGWNFTHVACGFRIYICDLKTEAGAMKRFREFVSGKSAKAFEGAEKKARLQSDFVQPPEPTPLTE